MLLNLKKKIEFHSFCIPNLIQLCAKVNSGTYQKTVSLDLRTSLSNSRIRNEPWDYIF